MHDVDNDFSSGIGNEEEFGGGGDQAHYCTLPVASST